MAIHATDLSSWKSTCEFTKERNLSFVHGATTLARKLALLKSTCESIEEKGLIVARSATTPAQGRVFSSNTCSGEKQFQCTQYISSFAKSTCQLIQGKSILAVTSATIYAIMLEVSKDICSSILVKKPFACNQCSFSCSYLSGLKYPRLSHTGETHNLQEIAHLSRPWSIR